MSKPISQRAARAMQSAFAALDAEAKHLRSELQNERSRTDLAKKEIENLRGRLSRVSQGVLLSDERKIAEWTDAPTHIIDAVRVAERIGCVLTVKASVAVEYGTTPPKESVYLEVTSWRREVLK